LRSTSQRLQDLRAALASGERTDSQDALTLGAQSEQQPPVAVEPGRSLPIDASPSRRPDSPPPMVGAGEGAGVVGGDQPPGTTNPVASENVFVPGSPSDGPGSQDYVQQPFTVRGQPRPYREVLGQYAQAGRDYVDRPEVAPTVRDLVKQYFSKLEEGE
jgi:hypothetical protein